MSDPNLAQTDPTLSSAALVGATAEYRPDTVTPAHRISASAIHVPGYRILGVLGRGGMGIVYKAIQEKANRPVALKMILAGAYADHADQVRFRAEAEAAARLSHPNIAQLYEVSETPDGYPFFSLEYIAGGTLAERLKAGPLPPAEAAAFVETLARAMQYAHDRHIVHRDLKPANILLQAGEHRAPRGTAVDATVTAPTTIQLPSSAAAGSAQHAVPKISDFGLAKQIDGDGGLTQTGAIMGTPSYMAPEQAFGQSKNVGPAADIYALGAILYECLTGRPPFKGATIADTLEQVRTMEPITLRAYAKEMPADLETICLHCLHKDPQRRYASAEALADDLRRFREGRPILVRPVGTPERVWRWCRRNQLWAAAIAAITLLLCCVTGVSLIAYFTVAAQYDVIQSQNESIRTESAQKEIQRLLAVAKQKEAEDARQEAVKKHRLSEERLDQSVAALKLFATDASEYCDDALVPGSSKTKLLNVLIDQLEQQAAASTEADFNEDKARSTIFMYMTLANTQLQIRPGLIVMKTIGHGLKMAERWLAVQPGNPSAQSYRAALIHLAGVTKKSLADPVAAQRDFQEAHEIRKKLRESEDAIRQIERHTPAKTLTDLGDSLDALERYEECVQIRGQAHDQVRHHIAKNHLPEDVGHSTLNAWCWTCWKAAKKADDYASQKVYLAQAAARSAELQKLRPGARAALSRWAQIENMFGDLEYRRGEQSVREGKTEDASAHFAEATMHFAKLADLTQQLATAPDLLAERRRFAQSLFDLGMVEERLGQHDAAHRHLEHCLAIRDEILRDYPADPSRHMHRIDRLFPLAALGQHAEAIAVARGMMAKQADKTTSSRLACLHALSITVVEEARRPAPPTPADRKLQAEYRNTALKLLEDAVKNGFNEWESLRSDPIYGPLRGEPRFKLLADRVKD